MNTFNINDSVKTNMNIRVFFHGKIIDSRDVESDFDFGDGPAIEKEFLVSNGTESKWIHQDNLEIV
jgi:hypothetical protein